MMYFRALSKNLLHISKYFIQTRGYTNRNIMLLSERGLFEDVFPPSCPYFLDAVNKDPVCVYAGFDPTADSLHIGNLLVIMALLHCQRAGHKVIALLGGATAQIGDPSGRNTERKLLSLDAIKENACSIEADLRKIFDNHQKYFWKDHDKEPLFPLRIVNNNSWYSGMGFIEFATKIGRNFRIGTMISKRSVEDRLKTTGLSFTEFTYQIFQAYDWLHLYRKYNCLIQIGGVDQLGNIHAGHELISRVEDKQVYGFMVPLVKSAEGDKFSKTGKAIWVNSDKTSPFSLYQFLFRLQDNEVEKYLKLLTFLPLSEIEHIMEKHWRNPDSRQAQKKLAEAVTLLLHGEEGIESAKRVSEAVFSKTAESLVSLSQEEFESVFNNVSSIELLLHPGTTVLKMAMLAHCFPNESLAKHTISVGGFYVNQRRVSSPDTVIIPGEHILPNNMTILRVVHVGNYYAYSSHFEVVARRCNEEVAYKGLWGSCDGKFLRGLALGPVCL